MKKCPHCGKDNADSTTVCVHCGKDMTADDDMDEMPEDKKNDAMGDESMPS